MLRAFVCVKGLPLQAEIDCRFIHIEELEVANDHLEANGVPWQFKHKLTGLWHICVELFVRAILFIWNIRIRAPCPLECTALLICKINASEIKLRLAHILDFKTNPHPLPYSWFWIVRLETRFELLAFVNSRENLPANISNKNVLAYRKHDRWQVSRCRKRGSSVSLSFGWRLWNRGKLIDIVSPCVEHGHDEQDNNSTAFQLNTTPCRPIWVGKVHTSRSLPTRVRPVLGTDKSMLSGS